LNKSQSRQQPYGATFFSLPAAGEFGDTSQQTISNQTGPMSLGLSDFSTADTGKLFTRADHRPVPVIPAKADTSDRGMTGSEINSYYSSGESQLGRLLSLTTDFRASVIENLASMRRFDDYRSTYPRQRANRFTIRFIRSQSCL
jgi:hypothetical protein